MHNRLNANAESVLYMHEKKVKHYPAAVCLKALIC